MSFHPYDNGHGSFYGGEYPIGLYLSNTFLWMFLGLMITFGTAVVCWLSGISFLFFQGIGYILIGAAQLILVLTLSALIERLSVGAARICFLGYSVLTGLTLSVYLYLFELTSLLFVFLLTALFFGVFGLYGRMTKQDLSGLGPILVGGLIAIVVYGLLSLFIPGLGILDAVMNLAGIAIFLGFTAYDMQKIQHFYYYYQNDAEMLEKATIFSALELYLDFINLFLHLVRFLGKRKD